jgi:competence protein ComEC
MNKSRIFIGCVISFAVGVLLASHFLISLTWVLIILVVTLSFVGLVYGVVKNKFFIVMALFLFCIALGSLRLWLSNEANQFSAIIGSKVQLEGLIVNDIDVRPDRQQLTFRPNGHDQHVLIITSKFSEYFYGDRILVSGKLVEPKSSGDFDYRAYLERHNTYALMYYPKVIVLRQNQAAGWRWQLLRVKYVFIKQIQKVLPEVESNLLLGILIGARKGLPQEVVENFNLTGISHIVAISGYNISIIIGSLGFLARRIGRKLNMYLTLVVVLAFVIVSGASSSVVRAALMGGLLLLAGNIGRIYTITPSLCLAGGLMLLLNPRILYWDAGFQLSFLATVGVVYLAPLVDRLTGTWPGAWGLKSILLTTLSAIAFTLPLLLQQFGRLSLIAPLANILILPIVPLTMLFGFFTALPLVGPGFGLVAHWLLSYMLIVSDKLAGWSYASTQWEINPIIMMSMYAALVLSYLVLRRKADRRKSALSFPEPGLMLQ